jgi:hypothetical protein
MPELRPVLVQQTAEMIHVLPLGERTETGAYGIPEGVPYVHVGDVGQLSAHVPDRRRKGTNATRLVVTWHAYTVANQHVGDGEGYPSRIKAVAGLLAHLGLVQVKATDTMEPLFPLPERGE